MMALPYGVNFVTERTVIDAALLSLHTRLYGPYYVTLHGTAGHDVLLDGCDIRADAADGLL
ncbi:hypothetical protein [Acidicapsa acidisoli]|uniref:hypothetical protein n=1 Tax=Acidicapsa acidisoli TaxID=1615681 RepID=UPI0021E07294|nr:hypothetical protein [Acidicapsa acidisoli]